MQSTDTVLSPIDQAQRIKESLLDLSNYLSDGIAVDHALIEKIHTQLAMGKLVTIHNAFKEKFAEQMFLCLNEFSEWKPYEDYSQDHFHYHHHNIYDKAKEPAALGVCRAIFDSAATRHLIHRLSGRECLGRTSVSASWYLPGDYSLPHSDRFGSKANEMRQVAFVWHLTKNWQTNWGGDLFWCPASRYISPSFNTLILFNVTHKSDHFVTTVSPYARAKRLAINGWWTGTDSQNIDLETEHGAISLASNIDAL